MADQLNERYRRKKENGMKARIKSRRSLLRTLRVQDNLVASSTARTTLDSSYADIPVQHDLRQITACKKGNIEMTQVRTVPDELSRTA